jgi:hypothetical protein
MVRLDLKFDSLQPGTGPGEFRYSVGLAVATDCTVFVANFTRVDLAPPVSQQALLVRFEELLAPPVVRIRRNALAAAERSDALFAPAGSRSRSRSSLPPRTAVASCAGSADKKCP